LLHWIPDKAVDRTLNGQVIGFAGAVLGATHSAALSFSLPPPVELATVMEDGSRVMQPGTYTLRFSRGHGVGLEAMVVLTGAPRLMRRFPSAFDDGDVLTINECDQRCNDFHPRTDLLQYKSFLWLAGSGALQHTASGKCVSVPSPAVAGSDARLLTCDATKPGPGQQWQHDNGLLKTVGACQRFPCRLLSIDACSGFGANWFVGNRCSRVSLPAEPGDERDLAVGRPAQPGDCRAVRFGGQS